MSRARDKEGQYAPENQGDPYADKKAYSPRWKVAAALAALGVGGAATLAPKLQKFGGLGIFNPIKQAGQNRAKKSAVTRNRRTKERREQEVKSPSGPPPSVKGSGKGRPQKSNNNKPKTQKTKTKKKSMRPKLKGSGNAKATYWTPASGSELAQRIENFIELSNPTLSLKGYSPELAQEIRYRRIAGDPHPLDKAWQSKSKARKGNKEAYVAAELAQRIENLYEFYNAGYENRKTNANAYRLKPAKGYHGKRNKGTYVAAGLGLAGGTAGGAVAGYKDYKADKYRARPGYMRVVGPGAKKAAFKDAAKRMLKGGGRAGAIAGGAGALIGSYIDENRHDAQFRKLK